MSKHTPGKWEADYEDDSVMYGGNMVAHVFAGLGRKGERKANARLIAAAPELLEACKGLLADIDGGAINGALVLAGLHGMSESNDLTVERTNRARAAIAKAEAAND